MIPPGHFWDPTVGSQRGYHGLRAWMWHLDTAHITPLVHETFYFLGQISSGEVETASDTAGKQEENRDLWGRGEGEADGAG